jgi:xanthine dehydrogenase YagR molybdenum-binding subunit
MTAVQDMGTGTRSVVAETVAREFGLEPHEVEVRIGDSALPRGPTSGGSRVTASIVPPLLLAAGKLKTSIGEKKPAPGSNAPWRELIAASPDLTVEAERPEDNNRTAYGNNSLLKEAGIIGWIMGFMMRRRAHIAIGAGAPSSVQMIEVEVDTLLGHVRALSVHSGVAVGKIAAPALARNQAAGSIVQGLGYALYEGREIDAATGDVLSANLEDYRLPGIGDIPPLDVHFDEGGFDHVMGRSVGIGEVATVPTAAALANAVRDAIGARPLEIPLRPDRVLDLLRQRAAA